MRVLIISAVFPPDIIGGAELSAHRLAQWLIKRGIDVGVLTTAKAREEELDGVVVDGLKIWRVFMPRLYPLMRHGEAAPWAKPLWHLQDHLDPRNKDIADAVFRAFKPDFVHIHVLQGLGYNILSTIAAHQIPTIYVTHDLGLVCVRMAMFRRGKECAKLCMSCSMSAAYKNKLLASVPSIGICSPSNAVLDRLMTFVPLGNKPTTKILNIESYPPPSRPRRSTDVPKLLFVGRLDKTKGIDLLLKAASELARDYNFTLTVAGRGPIEKELRDLYEDASWCNFTGFLPHTEISDLMNDSDLLCVPSIWLENSPGVILHALGLGLPVYGSDRGGIPELVQDGINGRLIAAGDLAAWVDALAEILKAPEAINKLRETAQHQRAQYEPDHSGKAHLNFMKAIANSAASS